MRPTLGFYFRKKKENSFVAWKRLVESTVLSVLDYGDIISMHAPLNVFKKLYVVYHAALRYVTGTSVRTHHCNLYEMTKLASLCLRRKKTCYFFFILKALVGKLPQYISIVCWHTAKISIIPDQQINLCIFAYKMHIYTVQYLQSMHSV